MHKPETKMDREDMGCPVIEVSNCLRTEQSRCLLPLHLKKQRDSVSETLCSLN
jgi:hypothetical protein